MYSEYDLLQCVGSFRGMHDRLVPITAWIGMVFDRITRTEQIPDKVAKNKSLANAQFTSPAAFLLHDLLQVEEEFDECNTVTTLIFNPRVGPLNNDCM